MSLPAEKPNSRRWTAGGVRAFYRFTWHRRWVRVLLILGILLAIFYQYENRNGARELSAARQRMIARAGTDNYMDLLPQDVPEAENFYAIPEIRRWRVSDPAATGGFVLRFPAKSLFPPNFTTPEVVEEPGCHRLDLEKWSGTRAGSGSSFPSGTGIPSLLREELGGGGGVIARLAEGLNRPASQWVPSFRQRVLAAGGSLFRSAFPAARDAVEMQRRLGFHLRAASLSEDGTRTRELIGIMLNLADGFSGGGGLLECLILVHLRTTVMEALNESLGCRRMTDSDHADVSRRLSRNDDIADCDRMLVLEVLKLDEFFRLARPKANGESIGAFFNSLAGTSSAAELAGNMLVIGPSGWWDYNHSFLCDMLLRLCGPGGGDWRYFGNAHTDVFVTTRRSAYLATIGKLEIPNPRRFVGASAVPAMSDLLGLAAQILFHRRCAILTCALHRHRLMHGQFPKSLAAQDSSLLPAPQHDPAKAGAPLNCQRTDKGFLLWSVGDDRADDGGDAEKDWLWRHEPW